MFLDDETMAPAAPAMPATEEGAEDTSADTMGTEKTDAAAMPSDEAAA